MVIVMRVIKTIPRIIILLFFLFLSSSILVLFMIEENYEYKKICRNNSIINIENYKDINYVEEIKILNNCDKIVLFFKVDDSINKDNINGLILNIESRKKEFNDNDILEIILKNNSLNYIVTIDIDERIDITF